MPRRFHGHHPSDLPKAAALAIPLRRLYPASARWPRPACLGPPHLGFFSTFGSSTSPVAIRATMTAAPITSAGRFSFRGPLGISNPYKRNDEANSAYNEKKYGSASGGLNFPVNFLIPPH